MGLKIDEILIHLFLGTWVIKSIHRIIAYRVEIWFLFGMTLIMRSGIILILRIILVPGIKHIMCLLNKLILRYHRILYALKNIWPLENLWNTCGTNQIYHLRSLTNKILIVGTRWSKRVDHCSSFWRTVILYFIRVTKNRWSSWALEIRRIMSLIRSHINRPKTHITLICLIFWWLSHNNYTLLTKIVINPLLRLGLKPFKTFLFIDQMHTFWWRSHLKCIKQILTV